MSTPVRVFVYGTLLFPEVTDRLGVTSINPATAEPTPLSRRVASLDGYERYTVRLREHGNFPAIVPGDGVVVGEVLECVPPESLARLDFFEGIDEGHYHREMVHVQCEGTLVDAFAYVCGDILREYLDGPWDVDAFRENDLEWYIENVVDPC